MKSRELVVLALAAVFVFSMPCAAAGPVTGLIVPMDTEGLSLVRGEKGLLTVGMSQGIVRGDIGYITADKGGARYTAIGRCAVTESEYRSSVCEIVENKKEIDPGSFIFFDPVSYTDAILYPVALAVFSQAVKPYEPDKRLKVCLYGIFDEGDRTTGLGGHIASELAFLFGQKNRIGLVGKSTLDGLIFYPDAGGRTFAFVKDRMRTAGINVLVTGRYRIAGKSVELTVRTIDDDGKMMVGTYTFPMQERYGPMASEVLSGREEPTAVEASRCLVRVKTTPFEPLRQEKGVVIRAESAGNAVVERALKRADFNVLDAVDVTVRIDGRPVAVSDGKEPTVTLPKGAHRVDVSFRRGYFFDESLLYTSTREVSREVLLELGAAHDLVMDVSLRPLFAAEPIGIEVYRGAEREKKVIRPIRRVEAERSIDVFKD